MCAEKWVLTLRRGHNVSDTKTTGVNEGYHKFFKTKLNARFPCMHSRRLDATVNFLFEVLDLWYTMRQIQYDAGMVLSCKCSGCNAKRHPLHVVR